MTINAKHKVREVRSQHGMDVSGTLYFLFQTPVIAYFGATFHTVIEHIVKEKPV